MPRNSIEVSLATRADGGAWEAYVEARGDATGYHSWRWRQVFEGAFGHECVYLAARQGGLIVGVLPMVQIKSLLFGRTLTSLPFLNYGGVMADAPEIADALIEQARDEARVRRCSHVELRHVEQQFANLPCKQHKVAMHLPVADGMWDRLDRKVRNQIRKAEKSGLVVERGGEALVNDFYTIFARNMRDLGTPVYGRRLFAEILREQPEDARLHLVYLGDQAIAGGLSYAYGGTVEVPSASSLREHRALCPNHLMYWSIIQGAIAAGRTCFDFGRSTPDDGTYAFKEQWGARAVPLHWEYRLLGSARLPEEDRHNPQYQARIEGWKKLPVPVATMLGPRIARLLP